MKGIRYVAVGLLLSVSGCWPETPAGGNEAGKKDAAPAAGTKDFDGGSMLPGMNSPPLLRFTLPADFVCTPFGDKPDMSLGVVWGRKAAGARVKKTKKLTSADSAFFMVRLSSDVAQESDDSFSHEKDLQKTMSSMGMKDVTTRKLRWGDYPVLTMTARRPNGTQAAVAWVGINQGSWVLFFDYHPAPGKAAATAVAEDAIWKDFLEKTATISEAESWKARGFDLQPGKTIFTMTESGIEGAACAVSCEERKRDMHFAFHVESLHPGVSLVITDAFSGNTPEIERLFGVQAHVRFSDKNASTELMDHAIPVIPKTVEEFSFSGKPLAAKDPVQIFGGPRVTAEMEGKEDPRVRERESQPGGAEEEL